MDTLWNINKYKIKWQRKNCLFNDSIFEQRKRMYNIKFIYKGIIKYYKNTKMLIPINKLIQNLLTQMLKR